MAKSNLTPTQKDIIDKLTEEFLTINSTKVPKGILFDVSIVINKSEEEKNFKEEVMAIRRAFNKKVADIMDNDMKKLAKDLALLGIEVVKENDRAYKLSHKTKCLASNTCYKIKYVDNNHEDFKVYQLNHIRFQEPTQFIVIFTHDKFYGNKSCEHRTLAEVVENKVFIDSMQYLYEENIRLKKFLTKD